MRCFSCFDSKEAEQLNPRNGADERRDESPMVPPQVHRLASGADRQRPKSNPGSKKEAQTQKDGAGINISAHIFTFRELVTATKNFSPECFLGEGGFGRVYRGRLQNSGQAIAVKQLDRNGLQGNREFLVEVLMLSLLHHPNLVNLIGYCADGDQRLLVYEYMPLGSLEDHLHDLPPEKEPLDWNTRMRIAAGAAKGLEYLHDKASPPVIYRDFKPSNILLDEAFHPKLSDFGLAKLGPMGDKSHVSTRVMGTYGYCAPEYAMTGQLTVKSDVYSFGVVLLELITGRKAIDSTRAHGEQNLVSWARTMFNDRKRLPRMADPRLQGQYTMRGLYQSLAVASMCINEEAAARPLIGDVVTALTYLANHSYEPAGAAGGSRAATAGEQEERGGSRYARTPGRGEDEGGSGSRWEEPTAAAAAASAATATATAVAKRDFDRERAVAEAKLWGENWREKRRATAALGNSDV